jgi:hypothetical protein
MLRRRLDTLNALLDAKADRLCNAQRHERSDARREAAPGTTRAQPADQVPRGVAEGSEAALAGARARSKRR